MNTQAERVELHPDLQRCRTRDPFGRCWLKHPLLVVPDGDLSDAILNDQYARKRSRFDLAVALDHWDHALALVEQPFCWEFLWHHREKFPPQSYWDHLSRIWTAAESFWEVKDLIPQMLAHEAEHRGHFTDGWGRHLLDKLPPLFRVFRGYTWGDDLGWAWTLSYSTADSFARRFAGGIDEADEDHAPGISTALARKQDVIGLVWGQRDYEVVIHPSRVIDLDDFLFNSPAPGTPHRALAMAALRLADGAFRLGRDSIHGKAHWIKVDHNAIELCRHVPEADLLVCRLFAFLHDVRREDEESDRGHGIRAAEFIRSRCGELTRHLSTGQLDKLLRACRRHELGRRSADPTVAVCWDSDRLDVVKTGDTINDRYLSTEAARRLKWTI